MTLETIKINVDRKIEKMIDTEKRSISEVAKQLKNVRENFKKILEADTNSSPRNSMITMYIDQSEKRIKDFEFADVKLSNNEYFAGADDLTLFKLIKFRDKVSSDVFAVAA
jgi:hypothetical protein